jgi:hypothetical protein
LYYYFCNILFILLNNYNNYYKIGLISEDEIRPFLNAHFLSCRILSKVIPSEQFFPPNNKLKAYFLIACLRGYEWYNNVIKYIKYIK